MTQGRNDINKEPVSSIYRKKLFMPKAAVNKKGLRMMISHGGHRVVALIDILNDFRVLE